MKIWGPNKNKESQKKNLVEPSLLSNNFVLKHTLVLRFYAVVNFVIDIMPKKKYETNNLPAPELIPFFLWSTCSSFSFPCFSFICLSLYYVITQLPLTLDCPFLLAPNVCLQTYL